MKTDALIREPAVSGLFYPEDPEQLRSSLKDLFDQVPDCTPESSLIAIFSPHAGYAYSGLTAAYGYKRLRGLDFTTVVVVSPSHREYFNGISVYPGNAYRTPLGAVPVDSELREQLIQRDSVISSSYSGHREEHALEVQLPFLQYMLGDFRILPVVMGDQRREMCVKLGDALAAVLSGEKTLMVASTDLSHFHPSDVADRLDNVVLRDVAAFDAERLLDDLDANRAEACGGGPLAAVLRAAKVLGASGTKILHHCNSGDVTGDDRSVVGYFSAIAVRRN